MAFVKDLYNDEIRDGYLVKSDMKKVWNRQLEIWQELDRICRKHKINYWAGYGTLIGAARHGGFIPWDDDMDFFMMRPEFNRFCKIAEEELNQSEIFEVGLNIFSNFRISHSQTTLIAEENVNKQKPKGLMVEVYPLDCALDGTKDAFFAANAINELMGTVYNYPAIEKHVQNGGKTVNDWSVIQTLHSLGDLDKQFEFLRIFAEGVFDYSSTVLWIERFAREPNRTPQKKSWSRETIYLPFESVQLPAPVDYDAILTSIYGDWRNPVCDHRKRLGTIYSTDIPYREFLKQINLDFVFPEKE